MESDAASTMAPSGDEFRRRIKFVDYVATPRPRSTAVIVDHHEIVELIIIDNISDDDVNNACKIYGDDDKS